MADDTLTPDQLAAFQQGGTGQALGSTADLESRIGTGSPGAYLSSQQPDQGEQPFVQDQSGAIQAQASQTAPPDYQPQGNPNTIKSLLTNFFGQHGVGGYLMNSFGMPTPEQRQRHEQNVALQQQAQQATTQYHQALAKNLADQNELVPVEQGPDAQGNPQEPLYVARRSQATILAKQLGLQQQSQLARLNADLKARNIGGQLVTNPDTGQLEFKPLAQSELTLPQQATIAQKERGPTSEAGLTITSLRGGPAGEEATAALKQIQDRRLQLARERGAMLNQRPLFTLQKVIENGVPSFMTGYQILEGQKEGRQIQPAGALSAKDLLTVQRLQSESAPALAGVRATIGTYDNAADRAIYARVLSRAGTPEVGGEAGWLTNIINQAAASGLSPEGQKQAIALRRLADTMGSMRSLMGLQATDQAMALTLSLLPGAGTPNSQYARQQVDQLEGMIKAAVELPALGAAKTPAGRTGGAKATHRFNPKTGKIESIP